MLPYYRRNPNRRAAVQGGNAYLLCDEFLDTLAAGAVNGTLATPGPGTRTVTDTAGTKLSITSGVARFVDASNWGDPGLWYNSVTRSAGRVLLSKVTFTAANDMEIGFDTGQATVPTESMRLLDPTTLAVRDTGGAYAVIGTVGNATYIAAVVLRTAGAYFFWNTGSVWDLMWIGAAEPNAALYPTVCNRYSRHDIEFVRIPAALWLPTPLLYDSFTRANGVIGTSETTGPDGQSAPAVAHTGGATWTVASNKMVNTPTLGAEQASGSLVVGTWYSITASEVDHFYTGSAVGDTFRAAATTGLDANNKVKALTLAELVNVPDLSVADVYAQIQIAVDPAGTQAGLAIGWDSQAAPANGILVYHNGTQVIIDKCVAGVYTTVQTTATAFSANAKLVCVRDGSSVTAYYANVKIGSTVTISDAAIVAATRSGVFSTSATPTMDNVLIFPRTGGNYSNLDQWSGVNP